VQLLAGQLDEFTKAFVGSSNDESAVIIEGYAPVANQVTANGVNPEGRIPMNAGNQTTYSRQDKITMVRGQFLAGYWKGNVNVRHDIPP
jgi:hypothetical protein